MDPAKVAGLATVLARAAKDRQVIVLTHDMRLDGYRSDGQIHRERLVVPSTFSIAIAWPRRYRDVEGQMARYRTLASPTSTAWT